MGVITGNGNGRDRWILGIFATLISLAVTGLVTATIAHGNLLAKITTQIEAIQERQSAIEGRTWADFRDLNERLRFVERRASGHPRP